MRAVGLNRSPSRPISASYSSSSGMISSRTIARTAAMSGRTLSVTPRSTFLSQKLFPRDMAPKFWRAASGRDLRWRIREQRRGQDGRVRLSRSFWRGRQFRARIEVFQWLAAPFPGGRDLGARRARRGEDRRRARRRSLGRPPFPGANRGISTACGAISRRDATGGRAAANARTAVGPLEAFSQSGAFRFLQVPQGEPVTRVAEGLNDMANSNPGVVSVNDAGRAPRSELRIQEGQTNTLAQIPAPGKKKLTMH